MLPQSESFRRALARFERDVGPRRAQEFSNCSLQDVQLLMKKIQAEQEIKGEMRHLKRLEPFLEAMKELGKVIEVFTNTTVFLCYIWGPIKFLLGAASTHLQSLDRLLDMYCDIEENLAGLVHYEATFERNTRLGPVLEDYYLDVLNFHKEALAVFDRPQWKILVDAAWKRFESKFAVILQALTRRKEILNSEKLSASLDQIIKLRAEIREVYTSQKQVADKQEEETHEERKRAIMGRLSIPDYKSDYRFFIDCRDDSNNKLGISSGTWIFDNPIFQAWHQCAASAKRVLYIHGRPGGGKSTLMATVIERLLSDMTPGVALAYFYFRRQNADKDNNFNGLLRALLGQLYDRDPVLATHIEMQTSKHDGLRSQVLQELVSTAVETYPTTYIVLDGLDECANEEEERTIKWLLALCDNSPGLRILFSGQRDGVLDHFLKSSKSAHSILLDTAPGHVGNIKDYCQSFARDIQTEFENELEPSLEQKIVDLVSVKADGMFLYAKLVLEHLLDLSSMAELKQELQPGVFPASLEEAYEKLEHRLQKDSSRAKSKCKAATRILSYVVCCKRTLFWREIQSLFSLDQLTGEVDFDRRPVKSYKRLCGSFLDSHTVNKDYTGPEDEVHLVHETAREFLIRRQIVNTTPVHLELSVFCSQYLLSPPFAPGIAEDEIISYARRGSYALQDYAVQYWLDHLRESIKACGTLQGAGCQTARQRAYLFLQSYGDHAKMSTLVNDGNFRTVDQVDQVVNRISEFGAERNLYFNIEGRTETIRQAIGQLEEQTFTSGKTKIPLSQLQGPLNVQKCSKPWCIFFKGNLQTAEAREKHINRHERPFCCLLESCPMFVVGYSSSAELQKHNSKYHTRSSNRNRFPKLARGSLPDDMDEKPKFMDLMLASRRGDTNTIDDLLGARTQRDAWQMVNDRNKSTGEAPLYIAAQNGHAQACEALLRWGADANAVVKLLLDTGNRDGRTALYIAAQNGHEAVVKLLLDTGKVATGAKDKHGRTALHMAAEKGHEGVVKLLLNTGKVDAGAKDKHGQTALYIAAQKGHEGVVKLLLDTGEVDAGAKDKHGRTALHMAAEKGHEGVVKLLLNTGKVDAGAKDKHGRTALHMAAEKGHEAVVKLLLDTGKVDADPKDKAGQTALYMAAGNGHEAVVKLLLDTGKVDAGAKDKDGWTALHTAARNGHEAVVKLLLDTGKVDADSQGWNGQTALHMAAEKGHEAAVKLLLDTGKVDADPKDKAGQTALYMAAENGHEAVVKLLLDTGKIDADPKDGMGRTALYMAVKNGYEAVVKLLLDTGKVDADPKDKAGQTALYMAAENGHEAVVKLLLDTGNQDGRTALYMAAKKGHEAVVKLLLNTGKVDAGAKDKHGRTALHMAAQNWHEAVVKLLLDTGKVDANPKGRNGHEAVVKLLLDTAKIDADAKDKDGWTALHTAAMEGHKAAVKLLLDTGKVDADPKDGIGRTALYMAAKNGHEAVVKLLLDTGKVDAGAKDKDGWTALHTAARNGHEAVVKLLLDTGKVDADSQGWNGQTALHMAAEKGHEAAVKLLLDTGKIDAGAKDMHGRTALHTAAENGHGAVVNLLSLVF
ncbi:hypothetical protein SMAC4_01720 [Sordaria macrospora]|uniref:uncharacterized protein n=1 Tax=Sordaria macrospora TaxID=5147 RepID=UPI002B2D233C|nr:hypothetical protein SMAC4_01720 [Sordaria macrospora]